MNNEKLDLAIERFTSRFDSINTLMLTEMGKSIKEFEGLNPARAYKLAQQLKHGQSVDKILNELDKASELSREDLKEILEMTAKENIAFANVYYQYKNLPLVTYETSKQFQDIVKSVEKVAEAELYNISKTTVVKLLNAKKEPLYLSVEEAYKEVIDRCVLSIVSGQKDYKSAISDTIKQLSESGIRKVYYDNEHKRAYTKRLDSAVEQNVLDAVNQINQETQGRFAKGFDADGVEITAHWLCAEDHQPIQGKQFSLKDWEQIDNSLQRHIETWNCRHHILYIVLGVSKPLHTDEELQQMLDNSNKEIEYQGRKYTKYRATQVQRRLETKLRNLKDNYISYKSSGDDNRASNIRRKIRQVSATYKEFSEVAGLNTRVERTRVKGYR